MAKRIFLCVTILFVLFRNLYAEEKFPFTGEITSENVNIRAGQNINFERLLRLHKGQEVVVVGKSYDWYEIRLPEEVSCYIHSKFLTSQSHNIAEVIGNRVNVRAGVTEKSSVLGQLNKGAKVKVKNQTGEWYQVVPVEGIHGWVKAKFVTFKSNDIPSAVVVDEPPAIIPQVEPVVQEIVKPEPEPFSVVGKVEDLGRIVHSKYIRHKLVIDNKTAYYLEDHNNVLDQYIDYRVKIEGQVKEKPEGFYSNSVIIVSNVSPIR